MKYSIIVHTGDPEEKGYPYKEALDSYLGFADEVIVVNGGKPLKDISKAVKVIDIPDPEVWDWAEHPKRLNRALQETTGDWIIKMDIDWILDEKTFDTLRDKLETADKRNMPVASMQRCSVYPINKWVNKGSVPVAINAHFRGGIKFGKAFNKRTDLVWPIFTNGDMDEKGVPTGRLVEEYETFKTGVPFWNFDCTFKTMEQATKQFHRSSLSYKEYFGETKWGESELESWNVFLDYMKENMNKAPYELTDKMLPKYIYNKYKKMTPEMFGYKGWGL